jgi:hypothetical protein
MKSKTYVRSLFHIFSAKTAFFRKKSFCGWDDASAPQVVTLHCLDAFVAQEVASGLLTALIASVICRLRSEVVEPEFFYRTGKIGMCFCRRFSCNDELVPKRRRGQSFAPFIDE